MIVPEMQTEASRRARRPFLLGLAVLLLCLPACRDRTLPPAVESKGSVVRVSGAWALYPLMVSWAAEYHNRYPERLIDVTAGGTGKGISDALGELIDIGMISRPIDPAEIERGARAVAVAKDAVFPSINANNPVLDKGLTVRGMRREVFADLFLTGRKMTWGEIAGASGEDPVHVFIRSDSHGGVGEIWARYLGGENVESLRGVAFYGDPGVADAVRRDPLSLGFNNMNILFDQQNGRPAPGLRIAPLDVDGNGRLDEAERIENRRDALQAVERGVYPAALVRDLSLIHRGEWNGPTRDFAVWIVTDGQRLIEENGYLPPSTAALAAARAELGVR